MGLLPQVRLYGRPAKKNIFFLLAGSGLSKGWSSSEKNKNIPNDFEKHMAISKLLIVTLQNLGN